MIDFPAIPYGQGVIGPIFESRTPEYLLDIGQDPRWLAQRLATEGGLRSFAGLPLVAGDRAVGVLAILFGEQRIFTPEEKDLMGLLADQAANAIHNVRLFEETTRRRREAEELARVAQGVTASVELPTVLERVEEAASSLLPDSSAQIWVFEGGRLVLEPAPGVRDAPGQMVLALGEGLGGAVALAREPLVVEDVLADSRSVNRDWMRQHGYVSFVGLPLLVRDRLLGVLAVFVRHLHRFSAEEVELLASFGAQAAIAIENARLVEDLKIRQEIGRAHV